MAERARPRQTNHTSQETNVLYTFEDGSQVCKSTRIRKRVLNLRRSARMRHRALGERLVFELEEELKSTIHYLYLGPKYYTPGHAQLKKRLLRSSLFNLDI